MYGLVKDEIARQDTIGNGAKLANAAREKGCLIIHCPFTFDEQWVEDKGVCGIVENVKESGAFRAGEWGAEIIDEVKPAEGDLILAGKRALSACTNTGLTEILEERGIKKRCMCRLFVQCLRRGNGPFCVRFGISGSHCQGRHCSRFEG